MSSMISINRLTASILRPPRLTFAPLLLLISLHLVPQAIHFLERRFLRARPSSAQCHLHLRKRFENRRLAFRNASSADISLKRAKFTSAKRKSPSSSSTALREGPRPASWSPANSSWTFCQTPSIFGQSNPTRDTLLDILWARSRAEGKRQIIEKGCPSGIFTFRFFDRAPKFYDFFCISGLNRLSIAMGGGKDMGMPSDQLFSKCMGNVSKAKFSPLFGNPGEKDDLEQEIAELLLQGLRSPGLDGLKHLIGLFDQESLKGLLRLFSVPGAPRGTPQRGH